MMVQILTGFRFRNQAVISHIMDTSSESNFYVRFIQAFFKGDDYLSCLALNTLHHLKRRIR